MKKIFLVLGLFWFLVVVTPALGQSFDLSWYNVEGSGGISQGGQFVLSGTAGQPETGTLNGGNYTLVGGFWAADWASEYHLYLPLILKSI